MTDPLPLTCGHTKVQHGEIGCARVTQIDAEIARVKRRAERRQTLASRLLPVAWRST